MTNPTVVLYPRPAPDVLHIGEQLLPSELNLTVGDSAMSAAELGSVLAPAEYLIGFIPRLPAEAWAAAGKLKLVQLLSAGYDNFPIDVARGMRLPVATNGGANAISVAEHAVMLMLAVYRRLPRLDRTVRAGVWRQALRGAERYYELCGKQVGLVGMGMIGRNVARRLRGFECMVVYNDVRRLAHEAEAELGVRFVGRDELLASSDIVSLHVPLLPETRGLIGADVLAKMKPTAVLINTARGELVDETALHAALSSGGIAGAGLDVFAQEPPQPDNPLFLLDNVVITPHSAGPTWDSWPRRFANGYANIERVARGEKPLWVIPELADLLA
jgi:phosphoglycerate dehydrogenase-like enzyme